MLLSIPLRKNLRKLQKPSPRIIIEKYLVHIQKKSGLPFTKVT